MEDIELVPLKTLIFDELWEVSQVSLSLRTVKRDTALVPDQ